MTIFLKENKTIDDGNSKEDSNNVDKFESKAVEEAGSIDPSCYKYEGEDCFYTEPASGVTYRWDKEKNQWVNKDTGDAQPASADPEQIQREQQNYKMEGGTYVYVDKLTNQNTNGILKLMCGMKWKMMQCLRMVMRVKKMKMLQRKKGKQDSTGRGKQLQVGTKQITRR